MHREPEYRRRRRQEAKKNEHNADCKRYETSHDPDMDKIIVSVESVRKELERSEDKNSPKNKREFCLKLWEIGGLWAAAAAGVIAIWVGNRDAKEQRRRMDDQILEMRTQSAIQRAEIRSSLELNIDRQFQGVGWSVSTIWKNIGKSDAIEVRGWRNINTVPIPLGKNFMDVVTTYNFAAEPAEAPMNKYATAIQAGDAWSFIQQYITLQQAQDFVLGKSVTFAYGYVEYSDIFGTFYTERYCKVLNFVRQGDGIIMPLPLNLSLPCERRTETPKKEE